jgi:hypothetical protein
MASGSLYLVTYFIFIRFDIALFVFKVHESGSLFTSGWRRRYLMLIRGGRQGSGPRGLGSLLILRKEPTPTAIAALVKPKSSGGDGSVMINKDLCKEISLRGADLALHYEKAPVGTYGFLLTHTLGGDLPLTAPTREERQLWLTELRKVLKRSIAEGDREVDGSDSPGNNAFRGKKIPGSGDSVEWERERSSVSMPRPSSFSIGSASIRNSSGLSRVASAVEWKPLSRTTRSPLTSEIASPRSAPTKSRPDGISLQVEVDDLSDGASSPLVSSPVSTYTGDDLLPPSSPSSPSARIQEGGRSSSFRVENRGNDRSRSAPSQRPPGNSTPKGAMNSPTSSSTAVPLQWRERMRRAAPARIEELEWDNLVAVATPDDFKDLGVGAGVSSVIVANTGGAVFFAFFKNRRHRNSDTSRGTTEGTGKGMLSKTISTVEELEEGESDEESSKKRSETPGSQSGAIRSRFRAKNTLAKGPSVRSSRNSTELEKLANFGDLDLDLEADNEENDDSTIMERHGDSEEGEDEEDGVLDKSTNLSEGEEEEEEDEYEEEDLTEQVCILKFCRNLMDTQSEFCANQMAMALHIQVK